MVFAAQDEVGDSDADFGDDVIFYGDVHDAADEAGALLKANGLVAAIRALNLSFRFY